MKRSLIIFCAAFLVSLGGGSGVAYMRARKAVPAAARHQVAAAKDSARHGAADSATTPVPPPAAGGATAVATTDTNADRTAHLAATAARAVPSSTPVPAAQPKVETAKTIAPPNDGRAAGGTAAALKVDSPSTARLPSASPGTAAGAIVGGRISKIFTAMSSKDAAKVLDQMDDADIVTILSGINDRKAAEVLGLLPVARAAGISKEVLKHRVGAQ
jgi:hypothetical protein